jgi:hypothetical protein
MKIEAELQQIVVSSKSERLLRLPKQYRGAYILSALPSEYTDGTENISIILNNSYDGDNEDMDLYMDLTKKEAIQFAKCLIAIAESID